MADSAWKTGWVCVIICVFLINSLEEQACYLHICAQLKQEEKASEIAQLPPKIADANARFIMICDKVHFPPSIDSVMQHNRWGLNRRNIAQRQASSPDMRRRCQPDVQSGLEELLLQGIFAKIHASPLVQRSRYSRFRRPERALEQRVWLCIEQFSRPDGIWLWRPILILSAFVHTAVLRTPGAVRF